MGYSPGAPRLEGPPSKKNYRHRGRTYVMKGCHILLSGLAYGHVICTDILFRALLHHIVNVNIPGLMFKQFILDAVKLAFQALQNKFLNSSE